MELQERDIKSARVRGRQKDNESARERERGRLRYILLQERDGGRETGKVQEGEGVQERRGEGGLSQQEERKWPREMDKVIDQPGGDGKTS